MAYTSQQGKSWLEENLIPLIILAAVAIGAIVVIALAANGTPQPTAQATVTVESDVESVGIKVYADSNRTAELTAIDWGTVTPLHTNTTYAYLYTDTTMDISIHDGNWQPLEVQDYLTFSYNIKTMKLLPDTLTPLNLTLTGEQTLIGSDLNGTQFTFTITIVATESPQRWVSYYSGWEIYVDESDGDAYYIGVNSGTREIFIRATLNSLKTAVDEAER